jgi:hypothetical protein
VEGFTKPTTSMKQLEEYLGDLNDFLFTLKVLEIMSTIPVWFN